MPLPSEHAARLRDPDSFAWIKEIWSKDSEGVRALGGQLKSDPKGATVEQTIRFKSDKWKAEDAKTWLKDNKYEPISFDPATSGENSAIPGYERRFAPMECRAVKDGEDLVIEGHSALFNSKSVDLGGFTEEIAPGAFDAVLASSPDVVCLRNHDPNSLLGRTPKTMTLSADKAGLHMRCVLPPTELGRETHVLTERGDLKGQSFGFSDVECDWSPDYTHRTIKKIGKLYDVGPVTFPAYPDTTVACRQREFGLSTKPPKPQAGENAMPDKKPLTPNELRSEAQAALQSAQQYRTAAQAANRELTAEEQRNVAGLLARHEDLLNQADLAEKLEAAEARSAAQNGRSINSNPVNPNPVLYEVAPRLQGNLRCFTPQRFGDIRRATDAAYRSGQWLLAVVFGSDNARSWCLKNGLKFEVDRSQEERGQVGNINTKGGYLVPSEMETALINVMDEYGTARRLCRTHRMTRDTMPVPIRTSGLTAYPIGETADVTESEKAWSSVELVARKWGVLVKYSTEIAEDAIINMADDLTMEIGVAMAYSQDDCWLNGTGLSAYHGIRGIHYLIEAPTWAYCKLNCVAGHDTLAEIDAADLANLYGKIPKKYRAGACWLCNPFTKAAVFDRLLQGAGGNMNAQLAAGQPSRYASFPIEECDLMYAPATAATTATTKVPILFGNFRIGCSFGDRRNLSIMVSEHRYMESDQLAIRGTARWDIVNHNANPTPAATTYGPVVGLGLLT